MILNCLFTQAPFPLLRLAVVEAFAFDDVAESYSVDTVAAAAVGDEAASAADCYYDWVRLDTESYYYCYCCCSSFDAEA